MLHPQNRALLDMIESRGITQPASPDVELVRDLQMLGPHGPIPMRLYRPLGTDATAVIPVLVYYHGAAGSSATWTPMTHYAASSPMAPTVRWSRSLRATVVAYL